MNIMFDHVNFNSFAGPNWFSQKLAKNFHKKGHRIHSGFIMPADRFDVHLAFTEASGRVPHAAPFGGSAPLFQRLDGIWYNTETDYEKMNKPIRETYEIADGVIFQSKFDRDFIIHHFGNHDNYTVIHNGTDMDNLEKVIPAEGLDDYEKVWCCASTWVGEPPDDGIRHIKRLNENLRYFQEHSGDRDVLCVAGNVGKIENPDPQKIIFLGELDVEKLISLYKRADNFIHLAKQDHCPNVVVDARAAGCHIICSNSGGTKEIAGMGATIINEEEDYGFQPHAYNVETTLDFSQKLENMYPNVDLSIDHVADCYLGFMGR